MRYQFTHTEDCSSLLSAFGLISSHLQVLLNQRQLFKYTMHAMQRSSKRPTPHISTVDIHSIQKRYSPASSPHSTTSKAAARPTPAPPSSTPPCASLPRCAPKSSRRLPCPSTGPSRCPSTYPLLRSAHRGPDPGLPWAYPRPATQHICPGSD